MGRCLFVGRTAVVVKFISDVLGDFPCTVAIGAEHTDLSALTRQSALSLLELTVYPAYNCIGQLGYIHETVNHSDNFIDPNMGANTQQIESMWGHVKGDLLRRKKGTRDNLLQSHLGSCWWFSLHKDTSYFEHVRFR